MLTPLPAKQWTETTAAHLLSRAGFGGTPQEISDIHQMGMDRAVSYLVDYNRIPDDTPPPDWATADEMAREVEFYKTQSTDPMERRELQNNFFERQRREMTDLRYWWLRRMALGPRPLQEKLTLFWHGHFASSIDKVNSAYWMWLQNETLRQNASGNFIDLLIAVSKDPAMLTYLDGAFSSKGRPNENFAREVMELFTLGEGAYTEDDIKEAAKAYTGWGISNDDHQFRYYPERHDDGPKKVFGITQNYTGEDLLRFIVSRPACAVFIVSKIWRYFVQDRPPGPLMQALAADFRASGLNVQHLMYTIFRSSEFYAPDVTRSQIKSPVDWLLSCVKKLECPLPPAPMALAMVATLGQELFQPPNVKGWAGGVGWITTSSLLDRYNFAAALVEGQIPQLEGRARGIAASTGDPDELVEISPANVAALFTPVELSAPDQFLNALQSRFLDGKMEGERLDSLHNFLKTSFPFKDASIRKAVRLTMSTPEFQLT